MLKKLHSKQLTYNCEASSEVETNLLQIYAADFYGIMDTTVNTMEENTRVNI